MPAGSSYGSTLGAASGPAHVLRHGGREYHVHYLTQAKKAEFERVLRSRALAMLPEMREALPPAEFEEARNSLIGSLAAGRYSFHGSAAREALTSPSGTLILASVLVTTDKGKSISEDELLEVFNANKDEFRVAVEATMADSAPRQPTAAEDPEGNALAAPTA